MIEKNLLDIVIILEKLGYVNENKSNTLSSEIYYRLSINSKELILNPINHNEIKIMLDEDNEFLLFKKSTKPEKSNYKNLLLYIKKVSKIFIKEEIKINKLFNELNKRIKEERLFITNCETIQNRASFEISLKDTKVKFGIKTSPDSEKLLLYKEDNSRVLDIQRELTPKQVITYIRRDIGFELDSIKKEAINSHRNSENITRVLEKSKKLGYVVGNGTKNEKELKLFITSEVSDVERLIISTSIGDNKINLIFAGGKILLNGREYNHKSIMQEIIEFKNNETKKFKLLTKDSNKQKTIENNMEQELLSIKEELIINGLKQSDISIKNKVIVIEDSANDLFLRTFAYIENKKIYYSLEDKFGDYSSIGGTSKVKYAKSFLEPKKAYTKTRLIRKIIYLLHLGRNDIADFI